ncbi:MAG: nucleoside monophosphate kinase [Endomicrobium sp.]|jgi:adenylate kinase|nr:nucleoside monophosphate kinase [Endomicrobium sp.]
MIKNYILIGPPGSGKGTQAKKLTEQFHLLHLSTGSIFRQLAQHDNNLKELITSGNLVPDTQVVDLISKYIRNNIITVKKTGILLDGFPRTLTQAKNMSKIFVMEGITINVVYIMTLNYDESINRLLGRRVCTMCGANYKQSNNIIKCTYCNNILSKRSDDQVNIIKNRFQIYEKQTKPLIEYYDNQSNIDVIYINGSKDENDVFNQITKHL